MPRSSLRDRGGPLRRGFRKNTAIVAGFSPVLLSPACSSRRLFVSPVDTGCDIDCPTQREPWVRLLGPAIHLRTGTLERNYGRIPSLTLAIGSAVGSSGFGTDVLNGLKNHP